MLAEKVRSVDPNAAWVLPKLFGLQVRARNWSAADATMSEAIKRLAVSAEKADACGRWSCTNGAWHRVK